MLFRLLRGGGDAYSTDKYGTTFDNQLGIIDKAGKTGDIVTGKVETFADLISALSTLWRGKKYELRGRTKGGREQQPTEPGERGGRKSPEGTEGNDNNSLATQHPIDGMGDTERGSGDPRHPGDGDIRPSQDKAQKSDDDIQGSADQVPSNRSDGVSNDVDTRTGSVDTGRHTGLSSGEKRPGQVKIFWMERIKEP